MREHHHTMFEYDNWANNLLIDSIIRNDIIDDRILSFISHIIWAKTVWMKRIKNDVIGEHTPFNIIPIQDLQQQAAKAHADYTAFIAGIDDFSNKLEYKNSRGDAWHSSFEDILTHVANHGTHHRAQICSRLKEIGVQPPSIDYIAYARM